MSAYTTWKAAVEGVAAALSDAVKAAIGATGSSVMLPTPVPGEPLLPQTENPTGQLWDADNPIRIMFEQVCTLVGGSGETVCVSAADTTAGYLDSKITVANGLAKSIVTPGGDEDLQLSPTYGSTANTICQGNDSRLSDDRVASGLRSATTVVSVSAATKPSAGQILTATSDSAATWQTPAAGGSFNGREEEFTAAGGDETFVLAANPAANANMLSAVNVLGVFRNGVRLRYQAAPAASSEFGFTGPKSIVGKALTAGDIISVLYSS